MIRRWLRRLHCRFAGHDLAPLRRSPSGMLLHLRCEMCGGEFCLNLDERAIVRWSPAFERFANENDWTIEGRRPLPRAEVVN